MSGVYLFMHEGVDSLIWIDRLLNMVVQCFLVADHHSPHPPHPTPPSCRDAGYPPQFNYRTKGLVMWQNLSGVDVLLYCVYVQEYGDEVGCDGFCFMVDGYPPEATRVQRS